MRRFGWWVLVVLVLALAVGAVTVQAQQGDPPRPVPVPYVPKLCYIPAHDLNGDGRVNEFDMNRWKDLLFKSGGECRIGAPASACPKGLDINGNGIITFDDLNLMLARWRDCVQGGRVVP